MASRNGTEKARVSESEEYGPNSGDPVSYQRYPTKIANPGPTGLFSFAATTFILSMFNVHTRNIQHPNLVVGMAIFAGGLTQFIAGMWEFPRGNVFGATAFASYGSFWMSYATINIPASGIMASFDSDQEFHNALGIYLITWFMITFFFLLAVLRRHIAFTVLLTFLDVALLLLSIAEWTGSARVMKAGGIFGIITGLVAFYIGVSELLAAEPKPILGRVPLGVLHRV
ncbi:fun34 transmembrane protein [Moniliophthora roreri MCA 2997]|uniref:Fun34 transmembrane protein n=2 Tax=Moniliophthora roreri TaxID=221103 RepID=V2X5J7_MONRO|nr:fun34 transmembrane protein [Moniliophthora roreri MCA 2997]KAI3614453.1 fun34 transmembrane protein [Moniliophthora roreri]